MCRKFILLYLILFFLNSSLFANYIQYIPFDEDLVHYHRVLQLDQKYFSKLPHSLIYKLNANDLMLTQDLKFDQSLLRFYSTLIKSNLEDSRFFSSLELKFMHNNLFFNQQEDSAYLRMKFKVQSEIRFNSYFSFFTRFYLDTKGLHNSNYPGHFWEASESELAGMNDIALLIFNHPRWGELSFGRQPLYWGHPNTGALMVSDNAPPNWMIYYQKRWKKFTFSYFTQQLNHDYDLDSLSTRTNRYFSGHRIDLILPYDFQVSFSETVVYGGRSRNPEPGYLFPFSIYFLEQFSQTYIFDRGHSEDDNLALNVEVFKKIQPNLQVYADLFVDDFQYDMVSEPNEIGYTLGVEYLKYGYWRIEGTKINNWVYGQTKPWNRYLNYHQSLGHWLGPDAMLIDFEYENCFFSKFLLTLNSRFIQKGEGSFLAERPPIVPKTKFPSGIVQSTMITQISMKYYFNMNSYFNLKMGYHNFENYQHLQDQNEDKIQIYFSFFHKFSINQIPKIIENLF